MMDRLATPLLSPLFVFSLIEEQEARRVTLSPPESQLRSGFVSSCWVIRAAPGSSLSRHEASAESKLGQALLFSKLTGSPSSPM